MLQELTIRLALQPIGPVPHQGDLLQSVSLSVSFIARMALATSRANAYASPHSSATCAASSNTPFLYSRRLSAGVRGEGLFYDLAHFGVVSGPVRCI